MALGTVQPVSRKQLVSCPPWPCLGQYPIGHTPASIAPGVSGFGELKRVGCLSPEKACDRQQQDRSCKGRGPKSYVEGGMCIWWVLVSVAGQSAKMLKTAAEGGEQKTTLCRHQVCEASERTTLHLQGSRSSLTAGQTLQRAQILLGAKQTPLVNRLRHLL